MATTTTTTTATTGGETSVVERTRRVSVWDLKPFLKKYTFEESTHDEEKRLMLVAQPTVSPSSSSSSSSSLETTTTTTVASSSVAAQPHQGHGHGKKKEPEYTEAQVDENGCAIVLWNRLLFPKKKKSTEGIISNRYLYMHPEDREPEAPKVSTIEKLFSIKKTVIIMCHGGYFAAAVFDKARLVAHKTFHSYIVRRKQGGRQSNRDKSGRRPKSGGAQIRRHNEEKHLLNVRALVNSWADHLTECDLILTHLPSQNKNLLIDEEREVSSSSHGAKHQGHDKEEDFFLSKNDPRLRTIPFATHRPSLSEVKRVFLELTTALLVTFEAPSSAQLLPTSGSSSSSSSSVNLRTSADPSALVDELRSSGDWEPSFKTRTSDDDEDDEERDEDDEDHDANSDQDQDESEDDEDADDDDE
eukprot:TRINITY_DN1869_c0_g2_i1.p1 TRINITY_DN1869_c0_g2~~TRINITY_DN1869_c0_g2_i1.p1  ORF type:complete len:415 (+),score=221.73 TRINITY_DN1869_c0_g2_i1:92-1336(+)